MSGWGHAERPVVNAENHPKFLFDFIDGGPLPQNQELIIITALGTSVLNSSTGIVGPMPCPLGIFIDSGDQNEFWFSHLQVKRFILFLIALIYFCVMWLVVYHSRNVEVSQESGLSSNHVGARITLRSPGLSHLANHVASDH